MAHYSCEMTSARSKLLSAKEDVFKYHRTKIAFNYKINCVKCLLVTFLSIVPRVVWREHCLNLLLGLLVFLDRGTQFEFVCLTNGEDYIVNINPTSPE